MDSVELICLAIGAGAIVVVVLVALLWRPFASIKHSDSNYDSGIGP